MDRDFSTGNEVPFGADPNLPEKKPHDPLDPTFSSVPRGSDPIEDLKKSNTEIDMKVRERLESMIGEILGKDTAVSLEFLIDYLHLDKDNENAIQELKLHIGMMDDVKHGIVVDDNDQSVYVFFTKISE